jgi:hypothetical protein
LKKRLGRDRRFFSGLPRAVPARPFNFSVVNDGDADAGRFVKLHPVDECHQN